jgi:hypothetical protein
VLGQFNLVIEPTFLHLPQACKTTFDPKPCPRQVLYTLTHQLLLLTRWLQRYVAPPHPLHLLLPLQCSAQRPGQMRSQGYLQPGRQAHVGDQH